MQQLTDGTSKTISAGEIIEGHTLDSSNMWTYGYRYLDTLRVTEAAINTPPGVDCRHVGDDPDACPNGAFGSDHPGGAQFVFADNHVEFLEDGVDLQLYQDLSVVAGAPQDAFLADCKLCTRVDKKPGGCP
jgi:prepilin-type processing-associated H-X9-DG protein